MQMSLVKNNALPALALALALALGILLTSSVWQLTTGVAGVSFYLAAILVSPFLGLLLWLVSYPFSPFLYLDLSFGSAIPDLTLSRVVAGSLFMVLLAQIAIGKRKPAPVIALDVVALVALLGIGLSVQMAEAKMRSAAAFLDAYVVPIVFYWVAKNLVKSASDRQKVVVALVVVGGYSAAVAINEQFTRQVLFDTGISAGTYSRSVRRIAGLLGSPVAFGVVLGMALPFAIHFLLCARRTLVRFLSLTLAALIVVGLYATAIRTAWIASILGMVMIVLLHPALRQRKARLAAIGLIALGATVAAPFGDEIGRAVLDSPIVADRAYSEGPILARMVLYGTGWQMFRDNPLRGVGFENFRRRYVGYLTGWGNIPAGEGMNAEAPHNSFVYVLVSAGLLGFVPYALLFVVVVVSVARAQRSEMSPTGRGLFVAFWAATLSYLLNALTSDVIYAPVNSIYFFALLGAFLAPVLPAVEEKTR